MRLATDFVPCRGVAISSETDVAPCLAFFASSVRSCFVNLLFARYGDDAAPAPITMKNVIVRAPSATTAPPLKPDMPLLSQLSLPQQRQSATCVRRSVRPSPQGDRKFSIWRRLSSLSRLRNVAMRLGHRPVVE